MVDLRDGRGYQTFADVRVENGGSYPGFLFLRHALAVIILLHHARILTRGLREGSASAAIGGGTETIWGIVASQEILRPFLYALVGAFFALSGFLVAGSALRNRSVKDFLLLRVFRLAPALFTEITLSAFILGPLVTTIALDQYFGSGQTYQYLLNLVGFVHYELPGVFVNNPIAGRVNENLWTLEPELFCYAILAIVMYVGLMFDRRRFGLVMLLVSVVLTIVIATHVVELETRQDSTRFSQWFIVYLFFGGVIFKCFEELIPVHVGIFVASGVAYVLLMISGVSDIVAGIFLLYCTMYVGSLRFGWFDRYCRWDISYGLYLYGYPITQTIVFMLVPTYLTYSMKSAAIVAVLALVTTVIFASASWLLIEKPALRLKKLVSSPRKEAYSPIGLEPVATREGTATR